MGCASMTATDPDSDEITVGAPPEPPTSVVGFVTVYNSISSAPKPGPPSGATIFKSTVPSDNGTIDGAEASIVTISVGPTGSIVMFGLEGVTEVGRPGPTESNGL